ncbi:phage antirepressor protein [Acinetobacter sp. 187]|uniref:phage antirepressor KilAC domain-containing protein n=1 Tax=Acinetobacter lanii TaxID=2715163 RepID=UPI001408768D|nr:phage regulatory protein/antirepressor Ant [Acinetobacter lanii]NHC02357.1 phage antirepressor protein [Acinetobacter lanii]
MNMLAQFQQNQKTMSSREIAQLCEKEHFNVKRDCEVMFKGLKLDALKFEGIYLDSMNRQQAEYLLDEELTMTLVTGYNIVLRNRVIKRWKELEQGVDLNNPIQLRDLLLGYAEKNIQLQQQVAILEPKAKGLDRIADCTNVLGIRESAKALKIGQNQLTQYLMDHKVVYRDQFGKIQAYQKSIDQKLVHVVTSAPRLCGSGEKVFTQVKLTQKLITRISAWLEKGVAA